MLTVLMAVGEAGLGAMEAEGETLVTDESILQSQTNSLCSHSPTRESD